MGGPAYLMAVYMVWRWPLKSRGFRVQGGVDWVQRSRRVVVFSFSFSALRVPLPLVCTSPSVAVLILEVVPLDLDLRSGRERVVGELVKEMCALPSHSMIDKSYNRIFPSLLLPVALLLLGGILKE